MISINYLSIYHIQILHDIIINLSTTVIGYINGSVAVKTRCGYCFEAYTTLGIILSNIWGFYHPIDEVFLLKEIQLGCLEIGYTITDWWFGTFFFHILGISSSQLTFIFFSGVGQPPTRSMFKMSTWLWINAY